MVTSTAALWSGPYIALMVGTNGIQSGDAVIANTFQRDPATTSNSTVMDGLLELSVCNVTNASASNTESIFDTGNDPDNGTVTWLATTGIIGILTFAIPIRGC